MKKRYSAKQKFFVLLSSALIGLSAGLFAYVYFASQMTDWQREQSIDFDSQTGATKFRAIINATSAGGIAFGVSAMSIIFAHRLMQRKK